MSTLFRYSQRYRTTWTGFVSDVHKAPGTSRPVYNMIDYIREVCRPLVCRARSYSGTTLSSDHKLVIGELHLDTLHKPYCTPNYYTPPVALGKLYDINVKKEYPNALKNNSYICLDASNSELLSVVWQRAADNVGETA